MTDLQTSLVLPLATSPGAWRPEAVSGNGHWQAAWVTYIQKGDREPVSLCHKLGMPAPSGTSGPAC